MNIFIGGSLDETSFHINNYREDVFCLTNIDTLHSEKYLRTKIHTNGLDYTFWIFENLDATLKAKRINAHLKRA